MKSGQLFWASEVINCVIVVHRDTKIATAACRKPRCPSFYIPVAVVCQNPFSETGSLQAGTSLCVSVFHKFVSSQAKEQL